MSHRTIFVCEWCKYEEQISPYDIHKGGGGYTLIKTHSHSYNIMWIGGNSCHRNEIELCAKCAKELIKRTDKATEEAYLACTGAKREVKELHSHADYPYSIYQMRNSE